MVMQKLFGGIYQDKTVLITGHTGFKGSWLSLWLKEMGANVVGYSLAAPTNPNHFELLDIGINSEIGDIRDDARLEEVFKRYKPEIVFHLAAQPLVRYSYDNPVETYETNVIGTLKVFEVCRRHEVKAIVSISSDKCYENREWIWGYRENDPMGGYDPYSSSKGCVELLVSSYRNSYFNLESYKSTHNTLLASCRAGNVIGGGDWGKDRLIPDIVKAASKNEKVLIRNPHAVRPWQHVLEPLSGYLMVGQKLLESKKEYAEGWNFGPGDEISVSVLDVVNASKKYWDRVDIEYNDDEKHHHEAHLLKLDCTKAIVKLGWKNIFNKNETVETTINWYKNYYLNSKINSKEDLLRFTNKAFEKQVAWVL